MERRLAYDAAALLEYAPVTREHVSDGGMSVEALREASITLSDSKKAGFRQLSLLFCAPGQTNLEL